MLKKFLIIAAFALHLPISLSAQSMPTREIKMPTETGLGVKSNDYHQFQKGFFASAEVSTAFSIHPNTKNVGLTELDIVGGYRFCDFLRVGLGLGGRLYFNAAELRTHDWALPLFVNVRGNFIPNAYNTVVPFWSFDIGTTFPDGFMIRPTVGIRVGQPRSAFIASLGYLGQNLRINKISEASEIAPARQHKFYNFITLKLGYEF